ncbi:MAG: hypothetical protein K2X82_08400 [Gemmataceae bacterium]|nr:hypothetical protein [Gemmataceae bacterium]
MPPSICKHCKKRTLAVGKRRCEFCLDQARRATAAARARQRADPAEAEKVRESRLRRYRSVPDGYCRYSGCTAPAVPGKKLCEKHRAAAAEARAKLAAKSGQ